MQLDHLFVGQIVHTKSISEFEIFINGFLAVQNGKILKIGEATELDTWKSSSNFNVPIMYLTKTQFLLPGFIDCHIHAPQVPNIGLGLDKPLLEWLTSYTFPLESEYKNEKFAKNVYEKVIRRTLNNGTTFAAYYATIHENSTFILAEEAKKQGQRALIGKSCSNCLTPEYYIETTESALADTIKFVDKVLALNDPLVRPIVTPRFAVCCDAELMLGLAAIANKYDLFIQTHISENLNEVKYIVDKHNKTYSEVYDEVNILTDKCILAHAVHLEDSELELIKKRGTSIAHCPASNTCLSSGFCDAKRIMKADIKLGLGTDVSGGNSTSILTTIRDTLAVSHSLEFVKKQIILGTGRVESITKDNNDYTPLTYKEAIYLATLGGARALGSDSIIGNFAEGKEFDGLLVDIDAGQIDCFDLPEGYSQARSAEDSLLSLVQKFIYVGDDRNIKQVFVKGRKVKI